MIDQTGQLHRPVGEIKVAVEAVGVNSVTDRHLVAHALGVEDAAVAQQPIALVQVPPHALGRLEQGIPGGALQLVGGDALRDAGIEQPLAGIGPVEQGLGDDRALVARLPLVKRADDGAVTASRSAPARS